MSKPFGWELLVDAYDCRQGIDTVGEGYALLELLVAALQVEKQAPPFVFLTDAKRFPDKAGISAWVPLVESGIQLHTLTVTRFACLDVYSCKTFDTSRVLDVVKRFVQPSRVESRRVLRGVGYPAHA